MMEGLIGFPEAECQKDKIKRPDKMNGFEASIDIWAVMPATVLNVVKNVAKNN